MFKPGEGTESGLSLALISRVISLRANAINALMAVASQGIKKSKKKPGLKMKKNSQKKILSILKATGLFSILSILSFAGLKTILSYTTQSLKKVEISFTQSSKEPTKKKWSDNTQQVIRKRMRKSPPKVQYRVCSFYDLNSFKFLS